MGKFSDNPMSGIVFDDINLTLGTLNTDTAIQVASKIDNAREQGFRVLKTEYFVTVSGKTNDEGPIVVGLAHNLSTTEIEEAIQADPQGSKALHRPENEQATRPVWPLKMIPATVVGQEDHIVGKDEVKLNWSCPEGTTLQWFAYNFSTQLTTGTIVHIFAKHFGVWLKD